MKAVILAGGIGTRLHPLTYTRPKAMLPIAGKPILCYIVTQLVKQGFEDIVITTGYMSEMIEDYFGDGSDLGARIIYSKEERPLGTAGSVKNAERYLDERFVVIQGDNITEIDFRKELEYHLEKDAIVTIAVKRVRKPWLFGVVELERDGRIKKLVEKPKPEESFSDLINTGLYVLEPSVLDYIPKNEPYDFARDLFPRLLEDGLPMYGYKTRDFWVDVGNPEGYMKAVRWILSKVLSKISNTAITEGSKIEGSVWIDDDAIIEPGSRIEGPAFIGRGAIIGRNSNVKSNSIIEDETKIGVHDRILGSIIYERSSLGDESIMKGCIVGENCKVGRKVIAERQALIGPNCSIGDEARITRGSRIWPNITIRAKALITGMIRR